MWSYEAGDHVAVFPCNDPSIVNQIGELLEVDLDKVISLDALEGKHLLNSHEEK